MFSTNYFWEILRQHIEICLFCSHPWPGLYQDNVETFYVLDEHSFVGSTRYFAQIFHIVFDDVGSVHTAMFSYENGVQLLRFCLAFTLLRCENGAFRKR